MSDELTQLKKMVEILGKNTFWTASGAILGLAALIVSFVALIN